MARRLKIFFDGGCRPNPGPMEGAVVARGIVYRLPDPGEGTHNEAEWLALLHAIEIARMLGATDVELRGDSKLVIDQANNVIKCRTPDLQRHLAIYREHAPGFARLRVRYIGRAQNLAGIALQRGC